MRSPGCDNMNKQEIMKALKALGEELLKREIQGEVLVVGGAAMCLAHGARDATKDVDALYEPKAEMAQSIQAVAEMYGLEKDWLNDGVKGFMLTNPERVPYAVLPGLRVTTVQPEYLLAMKLYSSRTALYENDRRDIKTLIGLLDIKSTEQALDLLEKYFPREMILPKTQYLLEEIIEGLSE